ncbi:hypothetical protein P175DRAFT_0503046 [Aspergillus ochraceoroseus IBT 24754]|uniref:Uncharacterized protein n=1 Tax=Aspergillus ochraceoroseus IBT 24754 TaxID=1392256 RepID=A0A2T5LTA3_9EURO|nr:uncharacterized protein P175DRAFT_0503046 [Aspergillus ochraceoroseus IBT 24754]PTU19509.1 hypothetical protein P175DRAFT_0503046 [Aspergillus ochraceoroseus IBT 24754]
MSPDLNSLPPSRSASTSPRQPRNLPTLSDALSSHPTSSTGVPPTTTANMNSNSHSNTITGDLPRRPYVPMPGPERRRSANLGMITGSNSYNENGAGDVSLTSDHRSSHRSSLSHGLRTSSPSSLGGSPIIATGDPHHQRAPSLGELHQELEQEQEAQVNRLLHTIRSQQTQLEHLQQQQQQQQPQSAVEDATPPSELSTATPPAAPLPAAGNRASAQFASSLPSRRASQTRSPNLRPIPDPSRGLDTLEWIPGSGENTMRRSSRDESGFHSAEAAMLARENQMLRQRIRELERQVHELTTRSASQGQRAIPSTSSQAPENNIATEPEATTGERSIGEPSDKT